MGQKQDVLNDLFNYCFKNNNLIFDNDLVKKYCKKHNFANPFDVTKLDNTNIFPSIMLKNDYFILHIGEGKHQFVKGINFGFHEFEEIDEKNIYQWKYRKSLLNDFDTSESNILSVGFNQRIIHDFLYEDIVAAPKVYNSRRTKTTINYKLNSQEIDASNLQMEIDLTTEYNGIVTIFEGKNNFPINFAVYQLFHPYLYYQKLKNDNKLNINDITCCYLLRKKEKENSIIRIYNYTFSDAKDMGSIKLIKSAQYNLIRR